MPGEEKNGILAKHILTENASERTPLLPSPVPSDSRAPEANASDDGGDLDEPQRFSRPKSVPDDAGHTAANQLISRTRGLWVFLALGILVFTQAANLSLLTTTQSDIAQDLDAYEQTSWFTSAYLIAMSSLGPLNGKLSAVFSPRLCIFVAAILLAIGSLICAWATTFTAFVVGRVVAGFGASGVATVSIIIVLELTGSKRKGIAIGVLNAGITVGVAVGATAAGALIKVIHWRAIFWLQAPLVLFAGIVMLFAMPRGFRGAPSDKADPRWTTWQRICRIDYLGAATLTASLVLMLYGLSSPGKIPILPIIFSVVVGVFFVIIEIYWAHDPVIPISLLTSRGLLLTCFGTVGFMMARWAVIFYTPIYAIAVRQWSAASGGSLLIPTNFGFAAGSILVGWYHIRRKGSFYLPTLISYVFFPVTLASLAVLSHQEGSPAAIVLALCACGFAAGAALNYNFAHLLHVTPKETHYAATALIATFRGFAGSFGTAVGGGIFARTLSSSLERGFAEHGMQRKDLIRQLLGSSELVRRLKGVEQEVAILGYEDSIKTLWLGAALLAVAMVFVQAGVGWEGFEEKQLIEAERQAVLHDENSRDREEGLVDQR